MRSDRPGARADKRDNPPGADLSRRSAEVPRSTNASPAAGQSRDHPPQPSHPARYDDPLSKQAIPGVPFTPRFPFVERALARAGAEVRLTGLALWRGAKGIYHGNDLTFA